jgi:hypothetical protein
VWPAEVAREARGLGPRSVFGEIPGGFQRTKSQEVVDQYNRSMERVRNFSKFDPQLKDIEGEKSVSFVLREAETLGLLKGVQGEGEFVDIPELQDVKEAKAQGTTVESLLAKRTKEDSLRDLKKKLDDLTQVNFTLTQELEAANVQ